MSVQQVFDGERRWGVAVGDCAESLREMPAGSVQCCVTSPPYFGLRSYLPADHPDKAKEIGLEETPEAYIARMVGVFSEVWRVLRNDGVCFINIADSYASAGGRSQPHRDSSGGIGNKGTRGEQPYHAAGGGFVRPKTTTETIKPKDRIGIPHMLAFALRADGWFFRDECIWHKPNPMPSSTTDRTTAAHEFVFMFSKSARYYYDGLAIAEKAIYAGSTGCMSVAKNASRSAAVGGKPSGNERPGAGRVPVGETRNRRSVWRISTRPYKGSHYATYPPKLVEPCILVGTSAAGCCPECGTPWVRVTTKTRRATRPGTDSKVTGDTMTDGNRDPQRHVTSVETTGWKPGCACEAGEPIGCIVLDPFVGSGTTLQVANEHGRRAVGCDLDERNMKLIRGRMELVQPMFAEV